MRPTKDPKLLERIHDCITMGRYRDTRHSNQRRIERSIDLLDVIDILKTGYHEKVKDEFRVDFQSWNYAIRGKTFEGDDLRVAIYFEEDILVIATVICL